MVVFANAMKGIADTMQGFAVTKLDLVIIMKAFVVTKSDLVKAFKPFAKPNSTTHNSIVWPSNPKSNFASLFVWLGFTHQAFPGPDGSVRPASMPSTKPLPAALATVSTTPLVFSAT